MDTRNTPLAISVLGVDDRLRTTLKMFFQGPCKGRVVMVGVTEVAEASIIDMDGIDAESIFQDNRASFPHLPVILLSLSVQDKPGIIYVQKPIQAKQMLAALDDVRSLLKSEMVNEVVETVHQPTVMASTNNDLVSEEFPLDETDSDDSLGIDEIDEAVDSQIAAGLGMDDEFESERPMVTFERKKQGSEVHRSAHKAAMHLDEDSYANFVGSVPDIDVTDLQQVESAHYDPKKFLQGYVQSAYNLARSKSRILRLNTGWKPIVIFPHSHEIWVDADDERMRGCSIIPVSAVSDFSDGPGGSKSISISPFNLKLEGGNQNPEMFQSMDAFMWKLALWSSAGRVPTGIDLNQPVFLRRWPNLTRFVLVPHSIRIAALLVEQPRSLPDVAKALGIRQQYVFSFFSAAYALGLASQSKQRSARVAATATQKKVKTSGFLGKILNRLRH